MIVYDDEKEGAVYVPMFRKRGRKTVVSGTVDVCFDVRSIMSP